MKKLIQFSKIITLTLIVMNVITWVMGMKLYWSELDHFNYMLDFTRSLAEVVLPYFCLSAADRMVYISENVKEYFENEKKAKATKTTTRTKRTTRTNKGEQK